MTLAGLALRNAARRRRRYRPAFVNLAFFGLAFTVLAGIGDSFLTNLESRAVVYYGGQGTLLTYQQHEGFWDDAARDPSELAANLRGLPWVRGVGLRHVFRQPGTDLVADGGVVSLRLVVGVDPEPGLADRWDLVAGSPQVGPGDVLLPRSVVQRLGVEVGASVMLSLKTYPGQRNTARLTVRGVYRDDPVFGRGVVYVDRQALNSWSGKPSTYGSENPLWIDGPLTNERLEQVRAALPSTWASWSHPTDKKTFLVGYLKESWVGLKSVLFSLEDHTKDLAAALTALRWALNLVALLLLVVAALGLGSTLRVLLHERRAEVGTMRALGMGDERAFALLLLEVEFVAALAVGLGVLLGYLVLLGLSFINLDRYFILQPLLRSGGLGYHADIFPGALAMFWALGIVFFVARPLLGSVVVGPPSRALGGMD